MAQGIHTEETFEALIEAHLVEHGGFDTAPPTVYDRERAVIPDILVDFVKATQPKAWVKLEAHQGASLPGKIVAAACKVMDQRGSLAVLRHGFKFLGQTIRLAYFQPGNNLNQATWDLYAQNRLTVVRQLRYDPSNDNELDLTLFLNGVPIVTVELKNKLTNQSVRHAVKQYKQDRDPKAPIFRWKQRALVHFAVGSDEVQMATRLAGLSTWFLPFNRGHSHGAGNPPVAEGHRTSYLWQEVWQRDSLLDIVGRFIHLQKEDGVNPNTGKKWSKETMIFPRYHQLDAVRKLVAGARAKGAGTNYLVQHSAGSGKSNSIAWLAHRLASLHDDNDQKVYDSVVVMTDRRVLDRQLQDTIYQFEHRAGVVEKIEEGGVKSAKLAQALESGAPIIICTIHSFGFVQDKIETLPDRRYALIVDEAHSSQSGEMAMAVKELLADSTVEQKLVEEADDLSVPDQLAMRKALLRGPQDNMSFFAFTATPKFKTLEMFGHKTADGKPAPFHLYSMRQAIEERFILDVLRGYTTYSRFFKLAKAVADDPDLDKRKAASALARFVNLHPTNIAQKTEIIIEHFRSTVAHQLGGKAKAMLVTGSRLQAVKYKQAFDTYIGEKGYDDVRCLVAFSGEVKDDKVPTVTYTEPGMNEGIKEGELPDKFASDGYQVLIVANKYQTGFDQPLLVAMYVDKRLAGVQAVQTLSRLNRMSKGKEETFVLDFVNKREDIETAFQPYYEATSTAEAVDPQRLHELEWELKEARVFTQSEVDGFAQVFFKLSADQNVTDNAKLNGWLDPAVDRFKAIKKHAEDEHNRSESERAAAIEEAVERQEGFRSRLAAFRNLYGFLGHIIHFTSPDLEKLYAYSRMLLRKLPRPETGGPLELDDDVALMSLKLKKEGEGDIGLKKGETGELGGPTGTGTGAGQGPTEKLSTIIQVINDKFGTDFDAQDLVDGVINQLVGDSGLQQAAKVNDKGSFKIPFVEALDDALVERHAKHGDFINKVFDDEGLGAFFRSVMLDRVYGRLQEQSEGGASVTPFRRVPPEDAKPFENCVPALDLKVAAGGWSSDQVVKDGPGHYDWVAFEGRTKPDMDIFVAQVVGESMNRRIPNGAWCVWRLNPGSGVVGKPVLAQHRDIQDPELEGTFTVKLYEPEIEITADGFERLNRVTLGPDSTDPSYEPIVLEGLAEGELEIVAELVEVLG